MYTTKSNILYLFWRVVFESGVDGCYGQTFWLDMWSGWGLGPTGDFNYWGRGLEGVFWFTSGKLSLLGMYLLFRRFEWFVFGWDLLLFCGSRYGQKY